MEEAGESWYISYRSTALSIRSEFALYIPRMTQCFSSDSEEWGFWLFVQDLTKEKDGIYFFPVIATAFCGSLVSRTLFSNQVYVQGDCICCTQEFCKGVCYLRGSVRFSL